MPTSEKSNNDHLESSFVKDDQSVFSFTFNQEPENIQRDIAEKLNNEQKESDLRTS